MHDGEQVRIFLKKYQSNFQHLALLLFSLILSACSTPFFKPRIALNDLTFEVAPQANDSSPIAVELVVVSDEEVLKKLLTLSAAQWFEQNANLKRDYPQQLQSWYYEITPGQRMSFKPTEFSRQQGHGLLLFANYRGTGAYRLRLDVYSQATILFSDSEVRVAQAR